MKDIDQIIIDALRHPHDDARLDAVVALGQPAYDRIVSRMYPCPGPSHPQEVDDKMREFVERIAAVDPSIITNNITHKTPLARFRVVSAAVATGNPDFADIVIERLTDRSTYVLSLVLWAIDCREYLRTRRAVDLLRKLLESKRVNQLMETREEIEALANMIQDGLPNNTSEATS